MNSYENIGAYFEKAVDKSKWDPEQEYRYVFSKDNNDNHIIELLDPKTDKLIMKVKYSIIGMYNLYNSVWYWGYNLSFVDQSATEKSRTIPDIANEIKKNYKKYDPKEADELHYIATNPNFYCSDENVLKVIQLGMYVMKGKGIIQIKYNVNDEIVHGKMKDPNDKNKKKVPIKKIEVFSIDEVLQLA